MPVSLPAWIRNLPEEAQESAKRVFLLRLAALYASEDGTMVALSSMLGRNPKYIGNLCADSVGNERGFVSDIKLVIELEKICGRSVLPREALRPDIFLVPDESAPPAHG